MSLRIKLDSYLEKERVKTKILEEEKYNIIKSIFKPKKYICFNEKYVFIKSHLKKNINVTNEEITYDSCIKFKNFICDFLSLYLDENVTENDYDLLCENDILRFLIMSIQNEYDYCVDMSSMMLDDIINKRLTL